MNYGMPHTPPATMPVKQRKPFDITKLPPEMQSQLAQGQPVQFEDGSTVYPDGTAEGAGDSPDDFTMGPAQVEAPLPPPPPDMLPGMMEPMAEPEPDVFAAPQFDRHFAVRDSAPTFFDQGEEEGNPMQDALPNLFEVPQPVRNVGTNNSLDLGSLAGGNRAGAAPTRRSLPGRMGRRMGAAQGPPTRPQPRRGR